MFMADARVKMMGDEEIVRVIYRAWSRSHRLSWCDETTGKKPPGAVASDVQTNANSPSLNRHAAILTRLIRPLKYFS